MDSKLIYIFCLFLSMLLCCQQAFGKTYTNYKLFRITPRTNDQLNLLLNLRKDESELEVDFWKETVSLGIPADVMVGPHNALTFMTILDKAKFDYEITVENVQRLIDSEKFSNEYDAKRKSRRRRAITTYDRNKFNTYDQILRHQRKLAADNSIVSLVEIGRSHEGRKMTVVKISNGGRRKPGIFIDGGFHAREWIAPAVTLYMMDEIVASTNRRERYFRDLLDRVDFYFLPVANPDGYEYSRTNDRLWRKTRSGSHCKCVSYNFRSRCRRRCARGVDLNRNFEFQYGGPGSSDNPKDDDFKGPKAWSEVEARNIRDFMKNSVHHLQSYITLHSYGQYWFYPYGYSVNAKRPSDFTDMRNTAYRGAQALESVHGTRYQVGNGAALLYPSSGTSDDWAKSIGIKWSYCLELRPDESYASRGFLLSPSQIPATAQETLEGLKVIFNRVANAR